MKDPIALEKDIFEEKYHEEQKNYATKTKEDYNDAVSRFGKQCASYIYETIE